MCSFRRAVLRNEQPRSGTPSASRDRELQAADSLKSTTDMCPLHDRKLDEGDTSHGKRRVWTVRKASDAGTAS
jgi:hypothetical protein